jgi:hypothetical protein
MLLHLYKEEPGFPEGASRGSRQFILTDFIEFIRV